MRDLEYSGTLKIVDRIRLMSSSGIRIFNLAGGSLNDTPLIVKEATKKAIDDGLGSDLTDSAGLLLLRELIAERLKRQDAVSVDPKSNVMVTVGAKNAILQAMQATLDIGDEVLIPDPFWPSYKPLVQIAGGRPKFVPMKRDEDFKLDVDEIRRGISDRTKMIIFNTPHNPTGRVLTKGEIEAVCDIAREYNLIVLSDECYEDLLYDNKKHYSIASFPSMKERTIIVYSFGKAYTMHGWRVGYAVGNEEIIKRMVTIQSNSVSCATTFSQSGAIAALRSGESHLRETVKRYQRLRDIAVERLNDIQGVLCDVPDAGFWVFPDVSKITDSAETLVEYLLREGKIAVTPGSAFGEMGVGHLRIIFRHEEEDLERGLDGLAKTIRKFTERVCKNGKKT